MAGAYVPVMEPELFKGKPYAAFPAYEKFLRPFIETSPAGLQAGSYPVEAAAVVPVSYPEPGSFRIFWQSTFLKALA
jgi:hypothetical protein